MNALVEEIVEGISHQRSNGLGRQCDHHEHWSDNMRFQVNDYYVSYHYYHYSV